MVVGSSGDGSKKHHLTNCNEHQIKSCQFTNQAVTVILFVEDNKCAINGVSEIRNGGKSEKTRITLSAAKLNYIVLSARNNNKRVYMASQAFLFDSLGTITSNTYS